ncbi:molybdate ABC transporter permease subunit [Larkinella rosea]|uniref:Molybdenum transport system permease n=1 Tax=Larkinella rosea TaxID=2025312 RepID=A0A3P1BQ58_9BACT|nr:molybdate ABC transporter permease subunit [Larkinella rosea]RRB02794.1 molybdate ABC transporter permease subunit [Larkinella rosea]
MTDFDWQPLLLTFRLATTTTLLLLLVGIPLAGWLAFTRFRLKPVIEAVVSLPLVLPPSVLGFYFLLAFSPTGFLGERLLSWFDVRLLFTFEGLVVASIFYSLPFMVHPVQAGLENLPASLREASYTLGKSRRETFFRVLLPNIKPSLLTGIVLSFAHTIGEFGLVLMIGGNLPGETRVASVAIYDEVELLHYDAANAYALLLLAVSFGILVAVYAINKRWAIF